MADQPPFDQQLLTEALEQLQAALELLDRVEAPAHIGAHVDLAIHQLRDAIAVQSTKQSGAQIATKAELH